MVSVLLVLVLFASACTQESLEPSTSSGASVESTVAVQPSAVPGTVPEGSVPGDEGGDGGSQDVGEPVDGAPKVLSVGDSVPIPTGSYDELFDYPPQPDDSTIYVLLAGTADGVFLGTTSAMPTVTGDGITLHPETYVVVDSEGNETALAMPESEVAHQSYLATSGGGVYV